MVPEAQVNDLIELYPAECESCWVALPEVVDAHAKRHQRAEVQPLQPHTTEWRRHAVTCTCGHKTHAAYDEGTIPASPFGPRLMGIAALLTGVYHLSRRRAPKLLSDLVGVPISLGAISAVEARVSKAVKPAVEEAWTRVEGAAVKHTDGNELAQGRDPAGAVDDRIDGGDGVQDRHRQLARNARAALRRAAWHPRDRSRAKALGFWAMERRQICWAHLLRKFVSFAERDGPSAAFGRDLLTCTGILFEYWHDDKRPASSTGRRFARGWSRYARRWRRCSRAR